MDRVSRLPLSWQVSQVAAMVGAAAIAGGTWDTVAAPDQLSGGGLTVTKISTGLTMPRATGAGISGDKFYELTFTGTMSDVIVGFCQSSIGNSGHYLSENNGSAGYLPTGTWFNSSGSTGTGRNALASGGTLLIAVKANGHVFIYDTSNVGWNNGTADPVTDLSPYTLGVILPVLPAISFTSIGGIATINLSGVTASYVNNTQVLALLTAGFTPYTG